MEPAPKSRLIIKLEAYRLWFEFLKVAVKSEDKEIKTALHTTKAFYDPWGLMERRLSISGGGLTDLF